MITTALCKDFSGQDFIQIVEHTLLLSSGAMSSDCILLSIPISIIKS